MTTIAYCRKQKKIAYDSRTTADGIIHTDKFNKSLIFQGEYYFFSGSPADIPCLLAAIKKESTTFIPNITCFKVAKNKKVYLVGLNDKERGYFEDLIDYNFAIGSGRNFAIAVLDMKNCAESAVNYAKTRDVYTGGRTRVFDIEKMKHE